jgi:hypothetical protein
MPQPSTAARSSTEKRSADRRPIDKFVNGPINVSIWENIGARGAFRAATIQLRYKDEKKGWTTGTSYGVTDLQHLENAAREARLRIENWQHRNAGAQSLATAKN